VSEEEIKSLPIGHFVAYLGDEIKKVYVLPANVPEEVGRKVALGELTSEFVRDNYLKKEVDEEMVWKEKYDQLVQEFEEWKKSVRHYEIKDAKELEQLITTLRQENDEMRKAIFDYQTRDEEFEHSQALSSRDQAIVHLKEQLEQTRKEFDGVKEDYKKDANELAEAEKTVKALKDRLEDFEALGEALAKVLPTSKPTSIPADVPSEINVSVEQPAISVKVERKQLVLSDKDLLGKIALIYAEGELGTDWFTVSDLTRAFEKHAWPRDPRASGTLDSMVQWGFLEKRYSGKRPEYKVKLTPAEAKSKGLLRVEE